MSHNQTSQFPYPQQQTHKLQINQKPKQRQENKNNECHSSIDFAIFDFKQKLLNRNGQSQQTNEEYQTISTQPYQQIIPSLEMHKICPKQQSMSTCGSNETISNSSKSMYNGGGIYEQLKSGFDANNQDQPLSSKFTIQEEQQVLQQMQSRIDKVKQVIESYREYKNDLNSSMQSSYSSASKASKNRSNESSGGNSNFHKELEVVSRQENLVTEPELTGQFKIPQRELQAVCSDSLSDVSSPASSSYDRRIDRFIENNYQKQNQGVFEYKRFENNQFSTYAYAPAKGQARNVYQNADHYKVLEEVKKNLFENDFKQQQQQQHHSGDNSMRLNLFKVESADSSIEDKQDSNSSSKKNSFAGTIFSLRSIQQELQYESAVSSSTQRSEYGCGGAAAQENELQKLKAETLQDSVAFEDLTEQNYLNQAVEQLKQIDEKIEALDPRRLSEAFSEKTNTIQGPLTVCSSIKQSPIKHLQQQIYKSFESQDRQKQQRDCTEYQTIIQDLQRKINEQRVELETKDQVIQELKQDKEQLQETLSEAMKQIDYFVQQQEKISFVFNNSEHDMLSLQNQLDEGQKASQFYQIQIEDLERKLEKEIQSCNSERQKVEEMEEVINQCKEQVGGFESINKMSQSIIERLERQIAEYKYELEEAKGVIEQQHQMYHNLVKTTKYFENVEVSKIQSPPSVNQSIFESELQVTPSRNSYHRIPKNSRTQTLNKYVTHQYYHHQEPKNQNLQKIESSRLLSNTKEFQQSTVSPYQPVAFSQKDATNNSVSPFQERNNSQNSNQKQKLVKLMASPLRNNANKQLSHKRLISNDTFQQNMIQSYESWKIVDLIQNAGKENEV